MYSTSAVVESELTSTLLRGNAATRRRAVRLLYALLAYDASDVNAVLTRHKGRRAALLATYNVVRYALDGSSPRLLYVLSARGTLLRSADAGTTWRQLWPTRSIDEDGDDADRRSACRNDDDGHANAMQRVTDMTMAQSHRAPPYADHVSSGCSDVVVIAGRGAFVAVSVDKGLHFTTVPAQLIERVTGAGATITHTCVVAPTRILVASGTTVAAVCYERTARDVCVGFTATRLLQCTQAVCLVHASAHGTLPATEVMVGEHNVLHVSWDGAHTFTAMPHALGRVRDVQPLDGVRNCCVPQLPAMSRVRAMLACRDAGVAVTTTTTTTTGTPSLVARARAALRQQRQPLQEVDEATHLYERGRSMDCTDEARRCLMARCAAVCLCAHRARVSLQQTWYRYYLVVGTGTEVLPYDYACLLCLGVTIDAQRMGVFTAAQKVRYTPLVCSDAAERPVGAVTSRRGGTRCIAARGNAAGIDVTRDFATWSAVTSAATFAPVGLFATDGGAFLVCTRRGVTATMRTRHTAQERVSTRCIHASLLLGAAVLR